MSAGDFFNRWSKNRTDIAVEPAAPSAPALDAMPAAELPPPTLEDVAALGHDADFRRFVQPGVDETVRRSAMKKLFTDPHFNVMDGLDIYIGDYNTYEPMSAAMVAMLVHGKQLLDPLGHLQQPAMRMLDRLTEDVPEPVDEAALATADAPSDVAVVDAEDAADTNTDTDTEAPEPATPEPAAIDTPKDPAPPQDDHTI
jgi:hypothetical protein